MNDHEITKTDDEPWDEQAAIHEVRRRIAESSRSECGTIKVDIHDLTGWLAHRAIALRRAIEPEWRSVVHVSAAPRHEQLWVR